MRFFRPIHTVVSSTTRMEIYSDAVMAIIITLLVLELHPPVLSDLSLEGVLRGLRTVLPNLGAFAFSFLTISVFWVNHHHFFHEIDKTDSRLLWLNNFVLFFLALVPFTTAFLAKYPTVPGVVMAYCFVLCLAAFAFSLMTRHALFSGLIEHDVAMDDRKESQRHTWMGALLYGIATVSALWTIWIPAILMLAIPLYYITPRLLHDHDGHE